MSAVHRESGLERLYGRLARALRPWRAALWVAGLAAVAAFAWVVLGPAGDDDVALMALGFAAVLWVAGLLTVVHAFAEPFAPLEDGAGLGRRLRWRAARLARVLMVWCMTALALVVVGISARALLVALPGG